MLFRVFIIKINLFNKKKHIKMKVISTLKDHINWFPGHMHKALRTIEQNTHKVDIFL